MGFVTSSLLYLLFVRLAIIAAAVINVFLGYRLFCLGIGTPEGRAQGTTVESSVATVKLSVRNAAPGTAFALFGAMLLIAMMVQSSPSATLETLSRSQTRTEVGQTSENLDGQTLTLRGADQNSLTLMTAQGIEYEKRGDTVAAERSYRQAVSIMAEPMNDLAWSYLNSGRVKDAVNLATIAVELRADEPRYLDTLSRAKAAAK